MSLFLHKKREMPVLQMAALPDLIFTVLFFFILVTHLREDNVQVKYSVPQGTSLTRMVPKQAIIHIYVGEKLIGKQAQCAIQVNDRIVSIADLPKAVLQEKGKMSDESQSLMTIVLKADGKTPMGLVSQIKEQLRSVGALRISYAATKRQESGGKVQKSVDRTQKSVGGAQKR